MVCLIHVKCNLGAHDKKLSCRQYVQNNWEKIHFPHYQKYGYEKSNQIQRIFRNNRKYQPQNSITATTRIRRIQNHYKNCLWRGSHKNRIHFNEKGKGSSRNNRPNGRILNEALPKNSFQRWKAAKLQASLQKTHHCFELKLIILRKKSKNYFSTSKKLSSLKR